MDLEIVKQNYKKVLEEIGMGNMYESCISDLNLAIKIAQNSNLYDENMLNITYILCLVNDIDMDILIDKKKLSEILGTAIYDDVIRRILFFREKPDYKERLEKQELDVLVLYNDIKVVRGLRSINIPVNKLVISDETFNGIINRTGITNIDNEFDQVMRVLYDIFSITYRYTFFVIEENKYLDNVMENLSVDNTEKLKKIYAIFKKHIVERL